MGEISAGNMRKHAVIYAIGNIVSRSVGFMLIPVYWHRLTESDYGIVNLVEVTVALLAQLLGFNLGGAMVRFYFETEDPEDKKRLASTAQIGLALIAAIAALVFGLLAPLLGPFIFQVEPSAATTYFRLTLVILFLSAAAEPGVALVRAEQRSGFFVCLVIVKLILEITIKIYLIVALSQGVMGVLYGSIAAWIFTASVLVIWLISRNGYRFSWPAFKKMAAYAYPLVFSGLGGFILHSADRFMLGWLSSTDDVGIYGMAYKFGYLANFVILDPFLLIWYPFIFSIKERLRQQEMVAKVATYFNSLMVFGCLGLSLMIPYVYQLLGEDKGYADGRSAIPVICFGYIFWALYQVFHTGFFIEKKTGQLPKLVGLAAAINIALNAILIPQWGYLGAAWATVVSFVSVAALARYRCERVFPVRYEWGRICFPLILGVSLYLVSKWMGRGAPWQFALDVSLLVAFPTALWISGFIRAIEKRALVDKCREIRKRLPV